MKNHDKTSKVCAVLLQDNAAFLYVDAWSSNFTWGGKSPPEEGSLVVITKGQTVLLDQNTPILKMLLIQGKFLKICLLDSAYEIFL